MKRVLGAVATSVCTVYIHIHVFMYTVREIYNTPSCTYTGVIFGFFILNIVSNCLWKRDHLTLKVKVLLVKAEELFTVFIDGFEEATPRMAINMYFHSCYSGLQVLMQLSHK